MRNYKHLSDEERYYIEVENKKGTSQSQIAKSLSRSQSSISRELKRNTGQRGYRHKQAGRLCQERHSKKNKATKLNLDIKEKIKERLDQDWSPEQIAGDLKRKGVISLHHETIYKFISSDKKNGGQLYLKLHHKKKPYRKRYKTDNSCSGIPNRVDIDQRPKEVDLRKRVGDWEGDTIIGKNHKGAILTLDERKTKLRLAAPLPNKKSECVKEASLRLLSPIKEWVKTMTFDNGKEFSQHEVIADKIKCDIYFAKPYHSWERGQNENANGLLRKYFPKDRELNLIENKEVVDALHKLNKRPRKCLGYKTPYQSFKELTGVDVEKIINYALMS